MVNGFVLSGGFVGLKYFSAVDQKKKLQENGLLGTISDSLFCYPWEMKHLQKHLPKNWSTKSLPSEELPCKGYHLSSYHLKLTKEKSWALWWQSSNGNIQASYHCEPGSVVKVCWLCPQSCPSDLLHQDLSQAGRRVTTGHLLTHSVSHISSSSNNFFGYSYPKENCFGWNLGSLEMIRNLSLLQSMTSISFFESLAKQKNTLQLHSFSQAAKKKNLVSLRFLHACSWTNSLLFIIQFGVFKLMKLKHICYDRVGTLAHCWILPQQCHK